MELLRDPSTIDLAQPGERVMLISTPALDVRLPWALWHQPVGLLQLGAALRARGCDVRLIDCLEPPPNGHLPRERVASLSVEGESIGLWRFGPSPAKVAACLRAWRKEGWQPDRILLSCGISTWWRGASGLIAALKTATQAPVFLGGAYPTFYPEHAATHAGADAIAVGGVVEAQRAVPDLTLYRPGPLPRFAGILLLAPTHPAIMAQQPRDPKEVAAEVETKLALGVTTFALFDDFLGPEHHEAVADVLRAISNLGLAKVRFVTVGNVSPRLIDDGLARLLRQARFQQIHLHDDLEFTSRGIRRLSTDDDYARCVRALHRAGFRLRTEEVGAGVVVGFPGEGLAEVVDRLVRLASTVGSINLVPYQYTPGTPEGETFEPWLARHNGHLDPTTLNAQLYPLARLSGGTLEDYRDLTRLAALLNSKYRSRTFDFRGDSLAARLLRASLREELWNPFRQPLEPRATHAPVGPMRRR